MTLKWKNIINILKNNWLTKKITFMISLHLQKGQANFQSFSTCKAIRIFLIKVKPTIEQLHQLTASLLSWVPALQRQAPSQQVHRPQSLVTTATTEYKLKTTSTLQTNTLLLTTSSEGRNILKEHSRLYAHAVQHSCIQLSLRGNVPKV